MKDVHPVYRTGVSSHFFWIVFPIQRKKEVCGFVCLVCFLLCVCVGLFFVVVCFFILFCLFLFCFSPCPEIISASFFNETQQGVSSWVRHLRS